MVRGLQRPCLFSSNSPSAGVCRRAKVARSTDFRAVKNHCYTPRPKPRTCTHTARNTDCWMDPVIRYGYNASSGGHRKHERATASDGIFKQAHPVLVSRPRQRLQAPGDSLGCCPQRFLFSTSAVRNAPPEASTPEPLDIDHYHRVADHYIDNLVAKLEEMQEEREDVDCEYSVSLSFTSLALSFSSYLGRPEARNTPLPSTFEFLFCSASLSF